MSIRRLQTSRSWCAGLDQLCGRTDEPYTFLGTLILFVEHLYSIRDPSYALEKLRDPSYASLEYKIAKELIHTLPREPHTLLGEYECPICHPTSLDVPSYSFLEYEVISEKRTRHTLRILNRFCRIPRIPNRFRRTARIPNHFLPLHYQKSLLRAYPPFPLSVAGTSTDRGKAKA
ncbi:hypothetical protein LXL04_020904 [Taraxacum kok-saghyz]